MPFILLLLLYCKTRFVKKDPYVMNVMVQGRRNHSEWAQKHIVQSWQLSE